MSKVYDSLTGSYSLAILLHITPYLYLYLSMSYQYSTYVSRETYLANRIYTGYYIVSS